MLFWKSWAFLHTRPSASPLLRLHVDIYIGQYCHWDREPHRSRSGCLGWRPSRGWDHVFSLTEWACWGRERARPPAREGETLKSWMEDWRLVGVAPRAAAHDLSVEVGAGLRAAAKPGRMGGAEVERMAGAGLRTGLAGPVRGRTTGSRSGEELGMGLRAGA